MRHAREFTKKEITVLAIAVVVVLLAVTTAQQIIIQKSDVNQLPPCPYEVQLYTPNAVQPGYYLGHNPECLVRMDNTTVRVDAGLIQIPILRPGGTQP